MTHRSAVPVSPAFERIARGAQFRDRVAIVVKASPKAIFLALHNVGALTDRSRSAPHHAAETAAWPQAPRGVDVDGHGGVGRSPAGSKQGRGMTGNSEGRRVATGGTSWLRLHHRR